jgi:hypothetical protein
MDASSLYQKTRKGEEEIKNRQLKLPPKLRTMLILIDGKKSLAQLNALAAQLGAGGDYAVQLEGHGLISGGASAAPPAAASPAGPADGEFERFGTARRFMNETVVNALGMRSFFFVLKLEKCGTRAELATLLEDYGKAIAKGADENEAAVLVERARELLA